MSIPVFWQDVARRAVNTAWQTASALVGAGQVDLFSLSWSHIGEAALGAAVLSVLKTLGVTGAVAGTAPVSGSDTGSASLDTSIEPGAS